MRKKKQGKIWRRLGEWIIQIFYPRTCPICGKVVGNGRKICVACAQDAVVIQEPKCQKCGKALETDARLYCKDCEHKQHFFDRGLAVFVHQGKLRESVYRFKYDNIREYADYYAHMAAKMYGKQLRAWQIDAIVPVPIHKSRELRRGYNQALVFAKALSRYTHLPVESKLLIRKKNTAPQKELTESMRHQNVKNAFAVNREKIQPNILLVDDIYTTGNTVDACSAILKKAGARHVYVLCISAGVDRE